MLRKNLDVLKNPQKLADNIFGKVNRAFNQLGMRPEPWLQRRQGLITLERDELFRRWIFDWFRASVFVHQMGTLPRLEMLDLLIRSEWNTDAQSLVQSDIQLSPF